MSKIIRIERVNLCLSIYVDEAMPKLSTSCKLLEVLHFTKILTHESKHAFIKEHLIFHKPLACKSQTNDDRWHICTRTHSLRIFSQNSSKDRNKNYIVIDQQKFHYKKSRLQNEKNQEHLASLAVLLLRSIVSLPR
jgi:hypothetical protein